MKIALATNNWVIQTKTSIDTREGLKELRQAAVLATMLCDDLEEFLDKFKETEE